MTDTRFRRAGNLTGQDVETLNKIIGRRMLVQGDHSWSGHTGEVVGAEHTPLGWGIKLKLDNGCQCLVMDSKHAVLL